jgi:hypothetical protein
MALTHVGFVVTGNGYDPDAIGGRIPVGSVGYGPESIAQMHAVFS